MKLDLDVKVYLVLARRQIIDCFGLHTNKLYNISTSLNSSPLYSNHPRSPLVHFGPDALVLRNRL
jgi:hypothetical protein